MSRIDDLIAELCPHGIEWRRLGEAMNITRTPRGVQRSRYSAGSRIPIIDQGKGLIAGYTDDDTLALPVREYVVFGDHTRAVKWVDFRFAVGADGTKVLVSARDLIPKFSYYAIASLAIPDRGYNRHWNLVRELRIPVPPLEVQREIVRILDTFTELEAELEVELEVELEARHQQYEHYVQKAFESSLTGGAARVPLGSIGKWYGGGTPSKSNREYWSGGTIPWISPKDMGCPTVEDTLDHITETAVANSSTKLVPANSVALVTRSSILDHTLPVAFVPRESALNQDMKAVIVGDDLLPRYAFHALRASRGEILRTVRRAGGSVASLDSQKLWKFEIPVPSLDEQKKIVDLLDRFDALVNDLSVGLPAELDARRKQYEYYRDKLLTFDEAPA